MDKKYLIALIAVFLLFFALRIPFLGKEWAVEEATWIRAGEGVAHTGFPWTYLGEQGPLVAGTWHGPLFPWLLGGAFKLFGESETVARSVPLLFSFGQLIIIYLLSLRLFGREKGRKIGLLAMFLVAINPFAIQAAVQIDIDGSLVAFFALLTLYAAWRVFEKEMASKIDYTFLLVASALYFLTRFEMPLIVFFGISVFFAIQRGWKAGIKMVLFFALAIMIALLVYFGYGAITGTLGPIMQPFQFLADMTTRAITAKITPSPDTQFSSSGVTDVFGNRSFGPFTNLIALLFTPIAFLTEISMWITVPLLALILFVLTIVIATKRFKNRALQFLLLPGVILALIVIGLTPTYNFPRYIFSAFLILTMVAAAVAVEWLEKYPVKKWLLVVGGAVVALLVMFTPAKLALFADRVRGPLILSGVGLIVAVLLGIAAGIFLRRKERWQAQFAAWLLAIYAVFAGVIVTQDFTKPYSLNAYYGNYGFTQAGTYLKSIAKPGDIIVMSDTTGYYYGGKYWDLNADASNLLPNNFDPKYIAIYTEPPGRFNSLIVGRPLIAQFGTVQIYGPSK